MVEHRLFKTDCESNDNRFIITPKCDATIYPVRWSDGDYVGAITGVGQLSGSDWWTGWTTIELPDDHFFSPSFLGGHHEDDRANGDVLVMAGSVLKSFMILPLSNACWDGYTRPLPKRVYPFA